MSSTQVKLNYSLRPYKQIERKIIIDMLISLKLKKFDLSKYWYAGMGSIFFYDFQMFHKYLGINKMICYETENIEKRMEFNKPFDFIDIRIGDIGDDITELLNIENNLFIWLDYEGILDKTKLGIIETIIKNAKDGTILLVSFNSFANSYLNRYPSFEEERIELIKQRILDEFGVSIENKATSRKSFPETLAKILINQVNYSSIGRKEKFKQLINLTYSDGTSMLTIGGIITKKDTDFTDCNCFYNPSEKPEIIDTPIITLREKHYLDRNINRIRSEQSQLSINTLKQKACDADIAASLDMKNDDLSSFIKYYKYIPTYIETFV